MRNRGQSGAAKEWGKTPNLASREKCSRSDGSRTSGEGSAFSSPRRETNSNIVRAAANGKAVAVEEETVTVKGTNSGNGAKYGEESRAFTDETPIPFEGVSP